MNKPTNSDAYGDAAVTSPINPDTPGGATDPAIGPTRPAAPRRTLTDPDLAALRQALLGAENPVTTRADLIEMHRRNIKMFETLNEGIGERYEKKAEADRAALSERIDALEGCVNRMEGALRIEFEPVLRKAVADVLASEVKPKRRYMRGTIWAALLIGVGLVGGAIWHGELRQGTHQFVSGAETLFGQFKANLSPNGGISGNPSVLE